MTISSKANPNSMVLRKSAVVLAVVPWIFALCAAPAWAQDWKAEWDRTVAAAEKEGTLTMESQPNRSARAFLEKEWAKAFPKIKLSINAIPSSQFMARIRNERKAGKNLWDFAISGGNTGYILSKEGLIDPIANEFIYPDLKDLKTWGGPDNAYFDLARKYVISLSAHLKSPFYDAKQVPAEKVKAMGLKILLDPAYKDKIIWHDPSIPGSGQSFGYVLRSRLGDEGLRKLVIDQNVRFVKGQHEVVEALARGTAAIGIGPIVTGLLGPYKKAGMKLDIHAFGNTPEVTEMSTGGATLYVFNGRPHPNATKVFVNWIMSKEVQTGFSSVMDQDSRRQDVPAVGGDERTPIKGVKYLETQREDYLKDVQAAGKFVAQLRRSRN